MYWAGQSGRTFEMLMHIKLLQKAGVIALGTDFPVEEVNQCFLQLPEDSKDIRDGFRWKMTRRNHKGMTIWPLF
jgi:hypothetical protein